MLCAWENMRYACRILAGKLEGRRFETARCRGRIILEWNSKN